MFGTVRVMAGCSLYSVVLQTQSPDPDRIEQPLPTMAEEKMLLGGWLHNFTKICIARTTGQEPEQAWGKEGRRRGMAVWRKEGKKINSLSPCKSAMIFLWRPFPVASSLLVRADQWMARWLEMDTVTPSSRLALFAGWLRWPGPALEKDMSRKKPLVPTEKLCVRLNRRDPQEMALELANQITALDKQVSPQWTPEADSYSRLLGYCLSARGRQSYERIKNWPPVGSNPAT